MTFFPHTICKIFHKMIKNEEKNPSKRTLHGIKTGHSKSNSRFLHIFFMIKRRFRTAADKPSARRAAPRLVPHRCHPCSTARVAPSSPVLHGSRRAVVTRAPRLASRRRRSCSSRWGCCHRLRPCPLRLRPPVKNVAGPPFSSLGRARFSRTAYCLMACGISPRFELWILTSVSA